MVAEILQWQSAELLSYCAEVASRSLALWILELGCAFLSERACIYISVEINDRYIMLKHLSYHTVSPLQSEFPESKSLNNRVKSFEIK
jgi:hypothetical protein